MAGRRNLGALTLASSLTSFLCLFFPLGINDGLGLSCACR
ncbi:hypothetical protein LOKO_00421 [Halomonas chromatireducens]|uniref:Uncharacterized protein n=1 Tax=Halomonas chromatireducens TaxID=507626 RepID=A0A0X8HBD6_9GAMM|nr:hypothetical protein LOKO_00421 [Halomonas chromatireducens]